jgi:hypothetical protein
MTSANQKYRNSGTTQPFKDWLLEEQKKGELEVHDEDSFKNAIGDNSSLDKSIRIRNRNILLVLGLGLAIYGIYRMNKSKQSSET